MARASEREQEVEKVRVTQVIQVRLEEEAHQEEKTVHITDHTANPSIKILALIQNQITRVNPAGNLQTDPIVDVMTEPQVVHQIVRLADRKEVLVARVTADHFVNVRRDLQKDQGTVHSGDQKDHQENPVTDLIAVIQKDHQKVLVTVLSEDQKDHQETLMRGHIVVVQRDQLKDQVIVHTERQKDHQETHVTADHFVSVPKEQLKDQETVHTERQKDQQKVPAIVHTEKRKEHPER